MTAYYSLVAKVFAEMTWGGMAGGLPWSKAHTGAWLRADSHQNLNQGCFFGRDRGLKPAKGKGSLRMTACGCVSTSRTA